MAVTTNTNVFTTVTSNKRIVTATVACAATADTWVTGLGTVEWVGLTSVAANKDQYVSAISGGTVTIAYDGGSTASFYAMAIGS